MWAEKSLMHDIAHLGKTRLRITRFAKNGMMDPSDTSMALLYSVLIRFGSLINIASAQCPPTGVLLKLHVLENV